MIFAPGKAARLTIFSLIFCVGHAFGSEKPGPKLVTESQQRFTSGERVVLRRDSGKPWLATVEKESGQNKLRISTDSGEFLEVPTESLLGVSPEASQYREKDRVYVTENKILYVGSVLNVFEGGWLEIEFDGYRRHEIHHDGQLTPLDLVTRVHLRELKQRHTHNEKVSGELREVESRLFRKTDNPVSKNLPLSYDCQICREEILKEESSLFCEECGSACHFDECLVPWLTNNVNQMAGGYTCVNPDCRKPLSFSQISRNKILAKRYLAATLDMAGTLIPCFRCGSGIVVAEFLDEGLKFQNPCPVCGFSACHRCGFLHGDLTCVASEKTISSQDIDALVSAYGQENVGGCPRCGQIIIKNEGCDEMTCGKNFHGDWSELQTRKTGCGHRFMWEGRLMPKSLKKKTKGEKSSCCVIL